MIKFIIEQVSQQEEGRSVITLYARPEERRAYDFDCRAGLDPEPGNPGTRWRISEREQKVKSLSMTCLRPWPLTRSWT